MYVTYGTVWMNRNCFKLGTSCMSHNHFSMIQWHITNFCTFLGPNNHFSMIQCHITNFCIFLGPNNHFSRIQCHITNFCTFLGPNNHFSRIQCHITNFCTFLGPNNHFPMIQRHIKNFCTSFAQNQFPCANGIFEFSINNRIPINQLSSCQLLEYVYKPRELSTV